MHTGRQLALLVLVDALLTLAVVHRVHQHEAALEVRRLALGALEVSRSRHKAMRR